MASSASNDFVRIVTDQIRFPLDRKIIAIELEDHIHELESFYIEELKDPSEAHDIAIQEMGDPVEIGKELNKVHKPIWGWLWLISKSLCIGLAVVVIFMSLQKVWTAVLAAQIHPIPTATATEILSVLKPEAQQNDLIFDLTKRQRVLINGDTVLFDRVILTSDGTLIILYQEVKDIQSFLIGSDPYPVRELSSLVMANDHNIHFRLTGPKTYQNHEVLIAENIPTDMTSFKLQFDGYADHFTVTFQR